MAYPAELFAHSTNEPNLFRCEKDGKASLLFGTYHVIPLDVIPKKHREIMNGAKTLILESLHEPRTEATLIRDGFISPKEQHETLLTQLTPIAREILENAVKIFCERHKLECFPLNRILLDRAIWICRFVTNGGGMDSTLEDSFSSVVGLEKIESITFDTMSIEQLNKSLENSFGCLRNSPSYPEQVLYPMDEYLAGASLLNPMYCYWQEQDEDMVVSRNKAWMPGILRYHAEDGLALIAVGHTHLVGITGLLCLLQQAGFKISQYQSEEDKFEFFRPDVLFKSLAENRAISKEIEITLDEIIETSMKKEEGSIVVAKDVLKESLQTLLAVQNTVYSLVIDYWAPSLVFSDIYPKPKQDEEKNAGSEFKAKGSV